jgi:hypothetical protein
LHLVSGAIALLAASAAGPPGEYGGGAMLVAPELFAPVAPVTQCGHPPSAEPRDLTFELLDPAADAHLPRLMTQGSRTVAFEWHASTGELTLAGATGAMFSDLETASTTSKGVALRTRSCGSR